MSKRTLYWIIVALCGYAAFATTKWVQALEDHKQTLTDTSEWIQKMREENKKEHEKLRELINGTPK